MVPAFHSWAQFFAMGGYGFYVWLSVAVTLVAFFSIILHTILHRRSLLRSIVSRQAREQRILAAKKRKQTTGEMS